MGGEGVFSGKGSPRSRHLPPPPKGVFQGARPRSPAGAGDSPRWAPKERESTERVHNAPGAAPLGQAWQLPRLAQKEAAASGGRGWRGVRARARAPTGRPAGEAPGGEARSPRCRPEPRARAAASAERAARITWCACRRSQRAHNGALGVRAERLPDAGRSRLLRLQRLHASPPGDFPEPAGRPGGRGRVR